MIEVCSSPTHFDYHNREFAKVVAARIAELGMEAYSFHAPFADHIDISSLDAGQRESSLQEILRAVETAALLAVHYFVIHPGPEHSHIPPHEERLRRMENTVGILNRVARRCAELGIRCLLENKLPHLLFGNTSDILWILDAIEELEVGACLDTGHAFLSGDLPNLVRKLGGHVRMIHAHDNRGHRDDHLPPGDGNIDWPFLTRELIAVNFRGTLVLEMAGTANMAETLGNARRGRSFLRGIARRAEMGGA